MNVRILYNNFWFKALSCFWSVGLVINIFFSNTLMAQHKVIKNIEWQIASHLPATNKVENQLGVAGPVVGLINDKLLIAGGANFPDKMPWYGGTKKLYNEIYLFEKDENGGIVNVVSKQKLPYKLAYTASVSTSKGIVFIGGETEDGLTNKVTQIQATNKTAVLEFKSLPQLPFAVANAAAIALNDKVYLAGGEITNHGVSKELLMLDMNALDKGWQFKTKLPKKLSHLMFVGNERELYVVGGRKRNVGNLTDFSSNVYSYDLHKNEWKGRSNLPYALSAGTSLMLGNEIVVFGGDKGQTFHKAEMVILNMDNEADTLKKQILNQIKIDIQTNHQGFSGEVLCYNTQTNQWNTINPIKFKVPVTTLAVNWNGIIFIPSGEIKAGVRTAQILRGKVNYK